MKIGTKYRSLFQSGRYTNAFGLILLILSNITDVLFLYPVKTGFQQVNLPQLIKDRPQKKIQKQDNSQTQKATQTLQSRRGVRDGI